MLAYFYKNNEDAQRYMNENLSLVLLRVGLLLIVLERSSKIYLAWNYFKICTQLNKNDRGILLLDKYL